MTNIEHLLQMVYNKQFEDAERGLSELKESGSRDPDVYFGLGQIALYHHKKLPEANYYFQRAADSESIHAHEALFYLGMIAKKTSSVDKARGYFIESLRRKPDYVHAKEQLDRIESHPIATPAPKTSPTELRSPVTILRKPSVPATVVVGAEGHSVNPQGPLAARLDMAPRASSENLVDLAIPKQPVPAAVLSLFFIRLGSLMSLFHAIPALALVSALAYLYFFYEPGPGAVAGDNPEIQKVTTQLASRPGQLSDDVRKKCGEQPSDVEPSTAAILKLNAFADCRAKISQELYNELSGLSARLQALQEQPKPAFNAETVRAPIRWSVMIALLASVIYCVLWSRTLSYSYRDGLVSLTSGVAVKSTQTLELFRVRSVSRSQDPFGILFDYSSIHLHGSEDALTIWGVFSPDATLLFEQLRDVSLQLRSINEVKGIIS